MIPSQWKDMELWALAFLKPLNTGVTFNNIASAPFPAKHVLINAIPGARVTPISRNVLLDLEVRCTKNGQPWPAEENRLANDIAFQIESATRNGDPIVYAELNTGPNRVTDTAGGHEFTELTVILEIQRT